mgnify:CR=1 FL=1
MVNRKYYSFERNNYYYGKMLTSRDFQNEQSYMNDKRRLVNRLLHGVGIVYGMDVIEQMIPPLFFSQGWHWMQREERSWFRGPR